MIRRDAYTVSGGSVNPPFSRRARRLGGILALVTYSPARQGWRDIDGLFVENRHLEMLLLYSVAALFCRRTFLIGVKQFAGITFQFLHFCIDLSSL